MGKWLEFEKLAAQIYSELQPNAQVKHNDKIKGLETGIERQIDVSIRSEIAGHKILIIVQAKDWKEPADVNAVGEFASVVKDIRAQKGVLICRGGFTSTALEYASNIGIDLCMLHDAESRDWSLDIKLPFLLIDYLPKLRPMMNLYLDAGDSFSRDPREWILSADGGKTRLLVFETFINKWNAGELDRRVGNTHRLLPQQNGIKLLVGDGIWKPVDSLILEYEVERRAWLAYFSPPECRGILDVIKGEFVPSFFKLGELPLIRDDSWKQVEDPDKLVITAKTIVTAENWQIQMEGSTFFGFSAERMDEFSNIL